MNTRGSLKNKFYYVFVTTVSM